MSSLLLLSVLVLGLLSLVLAEDQRDARAVIVSESMQVRLPSERGMLGQKYVLFMQEFIVRLLEFVGWFVATFVFRTE